MKKQKKKSHQTFIKKIEYNKNKSKVIFGYYGLKTLNAALLAVKQLESARCVISKITKRFAKLWVRIQPNVYVTKKPSESRMGKGVGKLGQ
jgi:ribosomal protein L16